MPKKEWGNKNFGIDFGARVTVDSTITSEGSFYEAMHKLGPVPVRRLNMRSLPAPFVHFLGSEARGAWPHRLATWKEV